jgi:hypothetical protein
MARFKRIYVNPTGPSYSSLLGPLEEVSGLKALLALPGPDCVSQSCKACSKHLHCIFHAAVNNRLSGHKRSEPRILRSTANKFIARLKTVMKKQSQEQSDVLAGFPVISK